MQYSKLGLLKYTENEDVRMQEVYTFERLMAG